MINVTLKPGQRRTSQTPDNSEYMIVNWRVITSRPRAWRPPTDVYEVEDRIVVRVEIAGMNESDFSISLDANVLTINGIRPDINERRAYHQMEINFGEFVTSVEFNIPIDSTHVRAEYQNGFLWVFVPKAQPKVIKINE
jgi:HSP20 family protein